MPSPDGPFTPLDAYFVWYEHERRLTFRWDGQGKVEAYQGDLLAPQVEYFDLQGAVYDPDEAVGWLQWFQHQCMQHVRMREVSGQPVVQPEIEESHEQAPSGH
jgi:hypothetical protein